jgi:hypothetical protein
MYIGVEIVIVQKSRIMTVSKSARVGLITI